MQTLSQRLRQFRAWQGQTLAAIARPLPMDTAKSLKFLASFESGEMRPQQYEKHLPDLALAYGVAQPTLERLLDDEYAWRVSAGSPSGGATGLPRMARYTYRELPDAAHNLFNDGFVVLDMETTGKDPHRFTSACEITILDTDGVPLLNSLINPGFHMPVEARLIHGIDDDMVADAPTFAQIGPEIARMIEGQIVVIYNAGFDAWLLDRLFIENGVDMPDFQEWCLMQAYANHMKFPGKYGNYAWQKLSDACAQQEIEQDEDAHRTLADTTMTWRLLQKLAMQSGVKQS